MLTPARAQTILTYLITTMMILTMLFLMVSLIIPAVQATLSLTIPLNTTLNLSGARYDLASFHLPLDDLPGWVRLTCLAAFSLLLVGVTGLLWRARQFTRRLLSDPFHPDNARDLTLTARLALIGQVFAVLQPLLNSWMTARIQPLEALRRHLPEEAVVLGNTVNTSLFSLFGVNLTPLLIAAVCVLFAAALTQAAHIREQERQLRAEQELTV
ncbi:hypothetical protein [Deinococcus sedimenti]|uniref:DUF2975 domain-containing protein n=1 Tax=Deinococcus sedimenti TaxID=1867090 RepID=A0ABQ2S4T2_9DEIO|nr:hypothetical protein [Deinococcus sedimenti]GGR89271.1 hypothetical protein GCM10008960_15390 [Deinococcus sedimenti]